MLKYLRESVLVMALFLLPTAAIAQPECVTLDYMQDNLPPNITMRTASLTEKQTTMTMERFDPPGWDDGHPPYINLHLFTDGSALITFHDADGCVVQTNQSNEMILMEVLNYLGSQGEEISASIAHGDVGS